MQIRLARYGWNWSGKFSVEEESEIPIRLRNDFDNTVYFVLVHVIKQAARVFVVFKGGDKFSPYRFENHTLETFKVRQKGQSQVTNLLPYHCCAYAWDEPLAPHSFVIDIAAATSESQLGNPWILIGSFDFDKLQSIEQSTNDNLHLRVIAQGPTRVLQIFDKRSDLTNNVSSKTSKVDSKESVIPFRMSSSIGHFGVSIIDKSPQELLYVRLSKLQLEYSMRNGGDEISLQVDRLQLDNQLWATPFPCLLHPWTAKNESKSGESDFLSVQITRDFEYPGIHFFPSVLVSVSPFEVNVEGTIVLRLLSLVKTVLESISSMQEAHNHNSVDSLISNYDAQDTPITATSPHFNRASADDALYLSHALVKSALKFAVTNQNLTQTESKIYIQQLIISEISVNLSVNPVISSDIPASDQSILKSVLSTVLLAIGSSLAKIENCPIRFKSFQVNSLFASSQKYVDLLISHYTMQAISQAYLVVGSSELLGNPVRLVRNLVRIPTCL